MKLKIAILEDTKNELTHLMQHLKNWSLYRKHDIEISVYSSGEEFFEKNENYISQNIDVFFLDIQMKVKSKFVCKFIFQLYSVIYAAFIFNSVF